MNSQNSQSCDFLAVEGVESVETGDNIYRINKLIELKSSTKSQNDSVEGVGKIDLTDYFSRLSTILMTKSVEEVLSQIKLIPSELEMVPRIPQIPHKKTNEADKFKVFNQNKIALAMEWIQIAIEEGHIEPSQPSIGRLVGWPVRSFSIESLYIDFIVWCRKKGLHEWSIPGRSLFFALLDEVLVRSVNRYEFPTLDTCREKFLSLKEQL